MINYFNILLYIVISFILVFILVFVSYHINKHNYFFGTNKPVECGSHMLGTGKNKIEIRYILVTFLFVIFEIELVILLP